jgi:uncharacterized membrane protein YcaP (DUF421 family)
MWDPSLAWWQFVARGAIVYFFLLFALRLTGKRQTGQLAPFDLILLLIISNAVQNAMNGGDNSVAGGLISATTLIALHYLMSVLSFRSKRIETLIDGRPQILVHNGVIDNQVMRSELLTRHELDAALRAAGVNDVSRVHLATLENNGQITVSVRVNGKDP